MRYRTESSTAFYRFILCGLSKFVRTRFSISYLVGVHRKIDPAPGYRYGLVVFFRVCTISDVAV